MNCVSFDCSLCVSRLHFLCKQDKKTHLSFVYICFVLFVSMISSKRIYVWSTNPISLLVHFNTLHDWIDIEIHILFDCKHHLHDVSYKRYIQTNKGIYQLEGWQAATQENFTKLKPNRDWQILRLNIIVTWYYL